MDNILSLIGLVYRAKKIYLGKQNLDNLKDIKYMFIASDASDKTKERFIRKCNYYYIEYCLDFDGEQLSKAIGKNNVKIIGIHDEAFKKLIKDKFK